MIKFIRITAAKFHNIFMALVLLFLIIVFGTLGFMFLEGFSFVEALYMTVITMSTVGYEAVHKLSEQGMIFAIILIVISFGLFAYAITSVTRFILDGELRYQYHIYKVNQRISQLKEHVIVCGYGRNGRQATAELLSHNQEVIIIERTEGIVDEISRENSDLIYINGDATQDEVLDRARVDKAKALITTLPSDAHNLFVVLTAREMNPTMTIISRASEDQSDSKLRRAGATNVIMPDKVGGIRMAKLVAHPDVVEFIEAILLREGDEVNIEEIACSDMRSCFFNKTIGELNIRSVSGANLIGLKTEEGSYIFNPSPEIKLMPEDKLFALGTPEQIDKLKNILEEP